VHLAVDTRRGYWGGLRYLTAGQPICGVRPTHPPLTARETDYGGFPAQLPTTEEGDHRSAHKRRGGRGAVLFGGEERDRSTLSRNCHNRLRVFAVNNNAEADSGCSQCHVSVRRLCSAYSRILHFEW
jgi:hypothetical protein